jgi:plasmid stabilization system protein ParE
MTGYVLSVDADLDLDQIWDYIARDSVDAADHWTDRLFDAFEALAKIPASATPAPISPRTTYCSGRLARI